MPLNYLNPIICAFLFALASLALKRGLVEGAGATRAVFVTNGVFFFALAPFWWFSSGPVNTALLWAPFAAGIAAFLGSVFQSIALKIGDVSVATPLLGGKVLFVALFSTLFLGNVLPLSWWLGAVLAGMGIFFLGQAPGLPAAHSRLALTVILSLLSVCAFAFMDVLMAGWGLAFGFQRFISFQQVVTFGLSLLLIPFFKAPLFQMPRSCWIWLLAGSGIIVFQFYILNWTISTFQQPTVVNIFYSSRGLWSVILVWGVGSFFGNRESRHGWQVFWRRAIGAGLLFVAICLVLLEKAFHL
ncbi:MAG TPA: DMT family transporter [Oceanipulchritudo sp.]|nr:DMT family transporter [Oceanipulchritudo sp.]